jgi:DHA1 family inner membrane transport protein
MSLLVCASTFAVFTYVAPLLREDTGISVGALPLMLLLFGVGGAAGMVIGGRLGDWKPLESIAVLSLAYAVFYLVLMAVIESAALVGAAMILWGFLFLAPCVPLQTRVVRKAIDGPNLASTLNQSAFNVGNALGPTLGAAALSLGFDYRTLPWIGSALALLCAATAHFSRTLENGGPVPVENGRPSAPR